MYDSLIAPPHSLSVPGPVTSLAADSRVTSAILTWDAPSSGTVTEYQVDYCLAEANEQGLTREVIEKGSTILTEDTSVEITELWPGTTYSVMVRTVNDAGAGNTVAIQATTENIRKLITSYYVCGTVCDNSCSF